MPRTGGSRGAFAETWPKKRLERLGGPLGPWLWIIGVAAFVAGTIEAAVLVIVAKVASELTALGGLGGDGEATFGPLDLSGVSSGDLLLIGGGLVAAYLATEITSGWAIARLLSRTLYGMRKRVLERHAQAPWAAKESLEGAALVQLATANATRGANTVTEMTSIIAAGINFAVLLAAAVVIDLGAAMLVAGGVTILLVLSLPLASVARTRHRDMANLNQRYASIVQEHSALSREIEVFGVQAESLVPIDDLNLRHSMVVSRSRWLAKANTAIFKASALGLVLALLAVALASDTDNIAQFAAVALILLRSVSYGQAVQGSWHGLGESASWLDQLEDDLAALPELDPSPPVRSGSSGILDDALEIELDGIEYHYNADTPVLRDISCVIPAGAFVGIVGASGSGKSTLAELLLGLREPVAGSLRLNGVDRAELAAQEWARSIAFVPQEPVLRRGTILDNVRFHRSWITDEDCLAALGDAHVLADIEGWPDGVRTDPGALGSRLSGGQKQRIAIARALAGQPSMLLFDEPTSALDADAERRVTDTIAELAGTKTIVVIAHRMSTLARCDALLALDDGRVAAYGPPDEVLAAMRTA